MKRDEMGRGEMLRYEICYDIKMWRHKIGTLIHPAGGGEMVLGVFENETEGDY